VIDATGIGYNGEAVPSASTITVQLTNTVASSQNYGLSATDDDTGLIYAATGTIAAGATIPVVLTHNAVVMPAFESGSLSMPLLGTSSTLNLEPRIDVKTIPASATQVTDVNYGDQTWMDRNLGARRVATVDAANEFTGINDVFSYGNYYQWGRPADGHEITVLNGDTKTNGRGLADATTTLATSATPVHDNFIISSTLPRDWLESPADPGVATLWDINDAARQGPCPANYHVPTNEEWKTADDFISSTSSSGATSGWDNSTETYNSTLKLPAPSFRSKDNGNLNLNEVGRRGYYWSSSIGDKSDALFKADLVFFTNGIAITSSGTVRAAGVNVRCIKNN
jgi:uncharacterized protein (TIGR02145 family)